MLIRKENYGARGGGITRPVGRGGGGVRGQHWDGHGRRRRWNYNGGYGPYGRYYTDYPLYNTYPVYDQIYTYPVYDQIYSSPTTSYDCPTMYHYDKSHIKADSRGCVKDFETCEIGSKFQPNNPNADSRGCMKAVSDENFSSETCEVGSHFHPNHPKADSRGCMKDLDMNENFTSSSASSTTEKSSSSTMYTLILVCVLLLGLAAIFLSTRRR